MVRIVHTGDMHFDSPFAALPPAVARVRKEEQKNTFLRIIEATRAYNADMLLIAGDMFDSRFVSADTIAFLKKCFLEIRDTAVFVAPGNHDFLTPDSPYFLTDFGENVHIFKDTLEAVEVKDAVVYGYGFAKRFLYDSVLHDGRLHTGEKAGILVLHGDIASESDYNPISSSGLSETGITYAALGHIHAYSGICKAGNTTYAYCGIPEGRHFDESGVGGFIKGEIEGEKADLTFVPVATRQNVTLEVDITGLDSLESVRKKISALLEKENLYKIVLCGAVSNTMYADTESLRKMLEDDCFYLKIEDHTKLSHPEEDSLLAKLFIQRLEGMGDAVSQKALKMGLEALRGARK